MAVALHYKPCYSNANLVISCRHHLAESFKWEKFLGELSEAVAAKQPTLFLAEHVNSLTTTYPDLFYALPQLRPSEPLVRLCGC
jgi:hypothetical protein